MAAKVARNGPSPHVQPAVPFQPHAVLVADAQHARSHGETEEREKKRRMAEEQQWRSDVIDMHRVMGISQALWLLLEHNNEAILRVAMEITMDPKAAECLWWNEVWYGDEEKREQFRKIVKDKLKVCWEAKTGEAASASEQEDDSSVDKAQYDALMAKFGQMEGKLNVVEKGKMVAEDRCRQLETSLTDANEKVKEMKALEKGSEELRSRVKELEKQLLAASGNDPSAARAAELEQKVKSLEQEVLREQERIKKLEGQLSGQVGKKELLDAEKRAEELERLLREQQEAAEKARKDADLANSELEQAKKDLAAKPKEKIVQAVAKKPVGEKISQGDLDAAAQEAEDERLRARTAETMVEQMKDDLARVQAELDESRTQLELSEKRVQKAEDRASAADSESNKWKSQAADLETAHVQDLAEIDELKRELATAKGEKYVPPPRPKTPPPVVVQQAEAPVQAVKTVIKGVPQEEHDKVLAELEKFKERCRKMKVDNDELKAANAELEDKNMRMLKMLHEIKEQLARVTALAEKKGLGDVVKQILEESKVAQTLESDEYTCFNRLYDDAKRRMEKQRRIQEEKFGIVGNRFRSRSPGLTRQLTSPGLPPGHYAAQFNGGEIDGRGSQYYRSTSGDLGGGMSPSRSQSPERPPSGFGGTSNQFGQQPYTPGSSLGFGTGSMPMGGYGGPQQRGAQYDGTSSMPMGGHYGGGHHMGGQQQQGVQLQGGSHHMDLLEIRPHSSAGFDSRGQSPSASRGFGLEDGNMYATGHRHHLGGAQPDGVGISRSHPAGALEVPPRRAQGANFSVEGFNPAFSSTLKQWAPQPPANEQAASSRSARPFGLGASASAGALLAGISPKGVSAMSMDTRGQDRSPPRRQLIESPSRLGEEMLPPLHVARSPTFSNAPGRGLRAQNDSKPSWRPPRKNVDDLLLGKGGGGSASATPNAGSGLSGWALSGSNGEGGPP